MSIDNRVFYIQAVLYLISVDVIIVLGVYLNRPAYSLHARGTSLSLIKQRKVSGKLGIHK